MEFSFFEENSAINSLFLQTGNNKVGHKLKQKNLIATDTSCYTTSNCTSLNEGLVLFGGWVNQSQNFWIYNNHDLFLVDNHALSRYAGPKIERKWLHSIHLLNLMEK